MRRRPHSMDELDACLEHHRLLRSGMAWGGVLALVATATTVISYVLLGKPDRALGAFEPGVLKAGILIGSGWVYLTQDKRRIWARWIRRYNLA